MTIFALIDNKQPNSGVTRTKQNPVNDRRGQQVQFASTIPESRRN
jgi:hypothetical protein